MQAAIEAVCISPEFKKLRKERAKLVSYLVGQTLKLMPRANPLLVRRAVEGKIDA